MIIAIDPGKDGGIAWRNYDRTIDAIPMPSGMTGQYDMLQSICDQNKEERWDRRTAFIEKVGGYVPGNSGPAACTFAEHKGHLEMALYALSLPTTQITPNVWMKALGFNATKYHPKNYKELEKKEKTKARAKAVLRNKNDIKEEMARRYPHLKVTLKTADALAILTYAIKEANELPRF